jgi:hypothetical protein
MKNSEKLRCAESITRNLFEIRRGIDKIKGDFSELHKLLLEDAYAAIATATTAMDSIIEELEDVEQ